MKVALLIPCYNESQTIEKVISDYRKVIPEAAIYVYDNNSTDGTEEVAKKAGAIVRHEYKQGKGNVIRRMFQEIEADCYVMIDGDDTYPASSVKELIHLVVEKQVDMALGDRLSSTYFKENKRPFHNFGNKLVKSLINSLFKSDIQDIMTGYRAFSKRFVKNFPVMSKGFEIETEMTIHALDKNFSVKAVPVMYKDRPEGSFSKLDTFSDGFKVLKTIFMLFRDYKPFVFFSIASFLVLVVSILLFVPVFIEYYQTGLVPRFPTLIVSGILGIISILLWISGIILEVIVKKHKQLYELLLNK